MDINEMKAKFAELRALARALHDKAIGESRAFTEDEQKEFDKHMDEAEEFHVAIEREERLLEGERRYAAGTPPPEPQRPSPDDTPPISEENRFKSFGEFLQAVRNAADPAQRIDQRLIETRAATGLSEGVPSDGGFLVQQDFVAELLKKTHEVGQLYAKTRKIPISTNANGMKINAIKETSRADGSRWGGVRAYWLAEAGTKTASKPEFRQLELNLRKLIGLCYATDELLQDAAALGTVITEAFAMEFAFKIDDAIINGTGAGQPLGLMTGGGLVTVAKETGQLAATIVFENVVKMWARLWARSQLSAAWYINQDILPQLFNMGITVGTAGAPVYMPPGGLSGSPYSTLFGRPVIPVEYCQTLGTKGDILLADLGEYITIDKGGIKADTSIHVQFVYDESIFRFVYRIDGQPIWNAALTPYKGTNTVSPYITLAART